jgi:hypothetical protein
MDNFKAKRIGPHNEMFNSTPYSYRGIEFEMYAGERSGHYGRWKIGNKYFCRKIEVIAFIDKKFDDK